MEKSRFHVARQLHVSRDAREFAPNSHHRCGALRAVELRLHPASFHTASASSPSNESSLPSKTLFSLANPPSSLNCPMSSELLSTTISSLTCLAMRSSHLD